MVVATGETTTRTFRGNDYAAMARWMSGFHAPGRGVAGCKANAATACWPT